jgi:hypothetical protein
MTGKMVEKIELKRKNVEEKHQKIDKQIEAKLVEKSRAIAVRKTSNEERLKRTIGKKEEIDYERFKVRFTLMIGISNKGKS